MRAFVMLRPEPEGRIGAFCDGLRVVGFEVLRRAPSDARLGDVLLLWNRRGAAEGMADRFECAGGTVLVVENGYTSRDYYAIARGKHNGGGSALVSDPQRAEAAARGWAMKPWREDGGHVLVLPNRFIGPRADLMPEIWAPRTVAHLQKRTKRPVRVRPHPGRVKPYQQKVPLSQDLRGAWCAVIWWSSAGVHALLDGIPVIYCGPYWIGAKAAGRDLSSIEDPVKGDRQAMLRDIGNAQFTVEEIASGLPFRAI